MILKNSKQPDSFDRDKYYIDLNELQNKSRSRLMFTFAFIAEKELGWKKKQINDVREELDKKVEFHTLVKEMNKHIGKVAVFYHGPGDEDETGQYMHDTKPNRGTPAKKRAAKKKKSTGESKKKSKSSQEAFDENLRKQVAKDYNIKGEK